jgi:tryptophan synthase beta chain
VDLALEAKKTGEKKVILFNMSGNGSFDLVSYNRYLAGELEDYEFPEEDVNNIRQRIPRVEESRLV